MPPCPGSSSVLECRSQPTDFSVAYALDIQLEGQDYYEYDNVSKLTTSLTSSSSSRLNLSLRSWTTFLVQKQMTRYLTMAWGGGLSPASFSSPAPAPPPSTTPYSLLLLTNYKLPGSARPVMERQCKIPSWRVSSLTGVRQGCFLGLKTECGTLKPCVNFSAEKNLPTSCNAS